jgi:hypothetical protein
MRAIEISDTTAVTGAWISGASTGRLDVLGMIRAREMRKSLGPPLMDPASYVWSDSSTNTVMVDFSKAGKGINISVPNETLQDWL